MKFAGRSLDSNLARIQDQIDASLFLFCPIALGEQHVENRARGVVAEQLAECLLMPRDSVTVH